MPSTQLRALRDPKTRFIPIPSRMAICILFEKIWVEKKKRGMKGSMKPRTRPWKSVVNTPWPAAFVGRSFQ